MFSCQIGAMLSSVVWAPALLPVAPAPGGTALTEGHLVIPPIPASSVDDRETALTALAADSGALKVLIFNDWSCGADFFGAWFKPPFRLACGQELQFYRWDFRQNISAMDAVLISLGQARASIPSTHIHSSTQRSCSPRPFHPYPQSKLLPPSTDLGPPRGPYNAAPDPQLKRPGQKWFGCSKVLSETSLRLNAAPPSPSLAPLFSPRVPPRAPQENGQSYGATSEAELRATYGIDQIMDYRMSSDQPQTFFSQFFLGDFAKALEPPRPRNTIRKLAVLQAKCDGDASLGENADLFRRRLSFIRDLAAVVPTDSMGPCMHNAEPRVSFEQFGGALGRCGSRVWITRADLASSVAPPYPGPHSPRVGSEVSAFARAAARYAYPRLAPLHLTPSAVTLTGDPRNSTPTRWRTSVATCSHSPRRAHRPLIG